MPCLLCLLAVVTFTTGFVVTFIFAHRALQLWADVLDTWSEKFAFMRAAIAMLAGFCTMLVAVRAMLAT